MKILDVPQSGSLAGSTSSRNRFGQYRRTRSSPVNPNTSRQSAVRSYLATNSQSWAALDDGQRAAWQYFSDGHSIVDSLGQTVVLTGHMMFNAVNTRLLSAGLVGVDSPPTDPLADAPTLGVPNLIQDGSQWDGSVLPWIPSPLPAGQSLVIQASPPVSAGVNFNGDFRFLQRMAPASVTSADIAGTMQAKWGDAPLGKKVFFRAFILRTDGGWSPFSNVTAGIVVAA